MNRFLAFLSFALVALQLSGCGPGGGTAQAQSAGVAPSIKDLSAFVNTYWYVPTSYLPAYQNIGGPNPSITLVNDQTVWHIKSVNNGYLLGCSFATTNNGSSWATTTMVGSVTANNSVSIGFYGSSSLVVGQGTLTTAYEQPAFLMQMSAGSGVAGLTHWAYMLPVTDKDPVWSSLPGTNGQSVPSATSGGC